MSQFHNSSISRNRPRFFREGTRGTFYCCLFAFALIGRSPSAGQLNSDQLSSLIKELDAGGDPHQAAIALLGIGSKTRSAGDEEKIEAVQQAVVIAAAILKTCDRTVPVDRKIARAPDFDATKYGGKPVFAGAAPETISDPVVREAYQKALSEHGALMERITGERKKLREAEYSLAWASETIKAVGDKSTLPVKLGTTIGNLKAEPWITEKIRAELNVDLPADAEEKETPEALTPRGAVEPPEASIPKTPSEKAKENTPTATLRDDESRRLMVWTVVILGCGGLFYLARQGRR